MGSGSQNRASTKHSREVGGGSEEQAESPWGPVRRGLWEIEMLGEAGRVKAARPVGGHGVF